MVIIQQGPPLRNTHIYIYTQSDMTANSKCKSPWNCTTQEPAKNKIVCLQGSGLKRRKLKSLQATHEGKGGTSTTAHHQLPHHHPNNTGYRIDTLGKAHWASPMMPTLNAVGKVVRSSRNYVGAKRAPNQIVNWMWTTWQSLHWKMTSSNQTDMGHDKNHQEKPWSQIWQHWKSESNWTSRTPHHFLIRKWWSFAPLSWHPPWCLWHLSHTSCPVLFQFVQCLSPALTQT